MADQQERFEAWFKDYYVKHGFISSKEEARTIWQAALSSSQQVREEALEEAAHAVQIAVIPRKAELAHLDPDDKLYFHICDELAKIVRELKMAGQPELEKRQPCGCVICTCENEEQCQGCGGKHCGTHPVGAIPNPVYKSPSPTASITAQEASNSALESCSKEEVAAFETWATGQKYDMTTHPIHWLFLNERTYAARQGWKAGLEFARASLSSPQEASKQGELVEKVFCEALSWGRTYGPHLQGREWDEMRDSMVDQYTKRLACISASPSDADKRDAWRYRWLRDKETQAYAEGMPEVRQRQLLLRQRKERLDAMTNTVKIPDAVKMLRDVLQKARDQLSGKVHGSQQFTELTRRRLEAFGAHPLCKEIDEALAATAQAPEPDQAREAVAWRHDGKDRFEVIHDEVKNLWLKVNPRKVECYTIPLYASPAPAQQQAAGEDVSCDQCIELAEQLQIARFERQLGEVKVIVAGMNEGPFKAGMETALEELAMRLGLTVPPPDGAT